VASIVVTQDSQSKYVLAQNNNRSDLQAIWNAKFYKIRFVNIQKSGIQIAVKMK
jgi:hypothetical protein